MAGSSSQSLFMIGGEGESSYANNSHFQTDVQSKLKPLVEEAIADLCKSSIPARVGVADLGCSSGPNALALMSTAVDSLRRHHRRLIGCQQQYSPPPPPPEISVYLNDLPNNDFNLVFKAVPSFLSNHHHAGGGHGDGGDDGDDGPGPLVLVYGAPGSFHGRLFVSQTLHLACSSLSMNWLSQVPPEVASGELENKGNVFAGSTSSPAVCAAYTRQFERDFALFLASRAAEVVPGGWLVLSLGGRPGTELSTQDRQSEFTADVLADMAARGVVTARDADAYNVPFYAPCVEELRAAAETEGSFEVVRVESCEKLTCDGDPDKSAAVASALRAVRESSLVRHFGQLLVDGGGGGGVGDEFVRTAEKMYRGPPAPVMKALVHVLSLRKK